MSNGVLVRGPLPFDGDARDDAIRHVDLGAVSKIAEHTRLELLSSFSSFDLGVALVDGSLVSAIAGKGAWDRARYGLLLDGGAERLFVLVLGAEIAPFELGSELFDVRPLALRALDVVRTERTRY